MSLLQHGDYNKTLLKEQAAGCCQGIMAAGACLHLSTMWLCDSRALEVVEVQGILLGAVSLGGGLGALVPICFWGQLYLGRGSAVCTFMGTVCWLERVLVSALHQFSLGWMLDCPWGMLP